MGEAGCHFGATLATCLCCFSDETENVQLRARGENVDGGQKTVACGGRKQMDD
jgi:hypothetical protein